VAALNDQLAALATMSSAQLRNEWLHLYRAPAPDMSPDLLRRGVAYRLQERSTGGLSGETKKAVAALMRQMEKTGEAVIVPSTRIKPGTRLVRDWGGASHHVLVVEDGFLYREQRYRSLSTIAQHITGAKWSGPRFFGLTGKAAVNA
jgi:hypothetical protein